MAASLVRETMELDYEADFTFIVSEQVFGDLPKSVKADGRLYVCNSSAVRTGLKNHQWDAIYTIFGPIFRPRRAPIEVWGLAAPLLVSPTYSHQLPRISSGEYFKTSIKRFRLAAIDSAIVETEDFAERLRRIGFKRPTHVIPNALSGNLPKYERRPLEATVDDTSPLRVAVVARNYPTKNLAFLSKVAEAFGKISERMLVFNVTLSDAEISKLPKGLHAHLQNWGPTRQQDLATLYLSSQLAYLPSNLEVFSAFPLEAMHFRLPVILPDFGFHRSAYGTCPVYVRPNDPDIVARRFLELANSPSSRNILIEGGLQFLRGLPTPGERAERTYTVIRTLVESQY